MNDVTPEELDASIERMRLDLAKALICRHLLRYLHTKVDRGQLECMQRDADYFVNDLRERNDEFRDIPPAYVTVVDGNVLAIRFFRELP